jgi:hypothetical protein
MMRDDLQDSQSNLTNLDGQTLVVAFTQESNQYQTTSMKKRGLIDSIRFIHVGDVCPSIDFVEGVAGRVHAYDEY